MTEQTHKWVSDTPRVRSGGEVVAKNDTFVPTEHELRCWPGRIEPADSTCDVVKQDGEICGRDRPCRFHDLREATDDSDGE